MEIGHLKEFLNVLSVRAKSAKRWANAQNFSFSNSLRWPIYVINPGDFIFFYFYFKKYWFSLPNRDSADGNEADHSQEFRYLHYYPARQPLKVSYLLNSEIVIEYLL